jgi:hypothetical protein
MDAAHAIPNHGTILANGAAAALPDHRRMVDADLPKALDMSHHLSELAKHRQTSALKELYKWVIPITLLIQVRVRPWHARARGRHPPSRRLSL